MAISLRPGVLLLGNKYRILSSLGDGGFGITYLAEQMSLRRKVAIKEFYMKEYCNRDDSTSYVTVLTDNAKTLVENYKQKFIKEAQMIASLSNPHIIRIYDIFEDNGTAYYVMEYLTNGSLHDKVKRSGHLAEDEAVYYINQVADALTYIHNKNILHLDVKPSNVLLDEYNNAVLIDFGISKHYSDDGSQTTSTPAGISKGFAPMEQYLQGTVSNFSPSTDVYSLGATLLYLLTGTVPPEAADINENGMPNFSEITSPSTYAAICKAMSPRRKDRPRTVNEFISLLTNDKSKSPSLIPQNDSTSFKNVDSEETTILKILPVTHRDKKPLLESKSDPSKKNSIGYVIAGVAAITLLLLVFAIRSCGNSTIVAPSILLNGISSTSILFGYEGETKEITLEKNFKENWTYSTIPEWCSIQTSSDSFSLTAKPNYSGVRREASIYFAQKGNEDLLASLRIYQGAGSTKAKSITMQSEKVILAKEGESFNLDYTISPSSAMDHKVYWYSTYPSIASVDTKGVITALKSGNTTITARVDDVEAKCNVEVFISKKK